MVLKITISEGHGINTPGKRTPAGEREWTFNNKMGQGFRSEIMKYGNVQIKLVSDPTGRRDVPLKERSDISNNWGADLYIAFHHNAFRGTWGTHTGTETYTYNREWYRSWKQNNHPAEKRLAKAVNDGMVEVYKLYNRGVKQANFHETREPKADAILTEGGYMDSSIDIKVMRDDKKVIEAGRNVARKVASLYGLKLKAAATAKPVDTSKETIYRVQVGSYSSMANAAAFAKTVEDKTKFSTYMVEVNGNIRVQVGAFAVKANAESRLSELKKHYKDAYIETNGTNAIDIAEPQNEPVPAQKSVDTLAREVLNGDHGNGDERKQSLGSRYTEVQRRVDELAKGSSAPTKSVGQMADEIIAGKHGNGHDRRRASLKISQALYNQVHAEVTRKLNVKAATAYVSVKVGDKVVIKNSASRYVTGQTIPASIKGKTYTVMQTRTGEALLKEIMSWVKTTDITKGGASVAAPKAAPKKTIGVGTRVALKSTASRYATGESIPASIKGKTYTVQQKGTRNGKSQVLLKEIVSWVWESDVQ